MIKCHLLRFNVDSEKSAADDFVTAVDAASLGKFPGSLGSYRSMYSGSVSVDEPKGNHVIKHALKRIKASHRVNPTHLTSLAFFFPKRHKIWL